MSEFNDFLIRNSAPDSGGGNRIETQKLLFEGPLADWASIRRNDFGEVVTPHHLVISSKKDRPHRVAWIQRRGMDFETGEPYDFYHVACDCMPEAELRDDQELMLSCDALITAITRRAVRVGNEYGLPELLQQPSLSDEDTKTLKPIGKQIAVSTIGYILERDQLHPDYWAANYVSGRHELPILSLILGREMEEVEYYVAMLEANEVVRVEGTGIKLVVGSSDEGDDTLTV